MRFIEERRFLEEMGQLGLGLSEDGRVFNFNDPDRAKGFDFSNFTIPGSPEEIIESATANEPSVESIMARSALEAMLSAGLFPIYLFISDNEWLDEDPESLVRQGLMTKTGAAILSAIIEEDHGMDVIVIEAGEIGVAVDIITPQILALGSTCYAVDMKGRAFTLFSQDDEVSFNTIDDGAYEKARSYVEGLSDKPFEVIW